MILIADSGSTKTDWTLLKSPQPGSKREVVATFRTQGISPIHQSPAEIRQILDKELLRQLSAFLRTSHFIDGNVENTPEQSLTVCFYGAGCTPEYIPVVEEQLKEVLSARKAEVQSDLMAAAHALCQHETGIACILGTGANSCLYDGEQIVEHTPALGYILGDEGSGAVLGRNFMNAIFKDPDYADIREEYLAETKLTMAEIISKVYREPMANRFLAATSLYIIKHLDRKLLSRLVIDNFRQFFRKNIVPYNRPDLPVHFVGSMASAYQEQLEEAARLEGFAPGVVSQSPMEGLVKYHS